MSSVRAIVAGHGTFADGMLSALEQITGRGDVFIGVTNRGLSAQGVEALLRERLAESEAVVIFTDLPAGSCTMAAASRLCLHRRVGRRECCGTRRGQGSRLARGDRGSAWHLSCTVSTTG